VVAEPPQRALLAHEGVTVGEEAEVAGLGRARGGLGGGLERWRERGLRGRLLIGGN